MKKDSDHEIFLIPQKPLRRLKDIPRKIYIGGYLSIFLALAALIIVYIFLSSF